MRLTIKRRNHADNVLLLVFAFLSGVAATTFSFCSNLLLKMKMAPLFSRQRESLTVELRENFDFRGRGDLNIAGPSFVVEGKRVVLVVVEIVRCVVVLADAAANGFNDKLVRVCRGRVIRDDETAKVYDCCGR